MRNWLLEAAAYRRQEEQAENPAPDPVDDPWRIRGRVVCETCRKPLGRFSIGPKCHRCNPRTRLPVYCTWEGCKRKAYIRGRCHRHLVTGPTFDE